MKGISDIIAVVLLVAFTIAVAAIVGVFFTSFTTTTTSTVSSQGNASTVCAGSYINVEAAILNSTTTNVSVTFSNPGRNALSSILIQTFVSGNVTDSVTIPASLGPGAANSTSIKAYFNTSLNEVRVSGLCLGTIPAVGSCFSGQPCAQGTY